MSATSRTDAHKVFADLYRKPRSPEHQQKIDEVIQKSNDIFIRIDLMKKVDEEFEQKREKIAEERKKTKRPLSKVQIFRHLHLLLPKRRLNRFAERTMQAQSV